MRLAQIARKVSKNPSEIRSFIKKEFNIELDKDPNIKIEDEQVTAILEHFKVEEPEEVDVKKEVVASVVEEIEIDPNIETDIESLKEVAEVVEEKIEIPEVVKEEKPVEAATEKEKEEKEAKKKVVGIKHASPEELEELKAKKEEETTEFKAVEVDKNAELIAAEIERLEGLKVIGKIELEDDKETKKLMNEEVELPTADSVESEIDNLDGELDTSEFPDLGEGESDETKEAIFAELDAQMENKAAQKVKSGTSKPAREITENTDEDEDSIYKDSKGIYHFTSEQRANRRKSLEEKRAKELAKKQKEKKARHYKENVAAVAQPKKKKAPSKRAEKKIAAKQAKKDAPTSLWGKFVNWLNDRD